ncbi:MAG: hypothetical protein RBS17_01905 [Coriobacteriia bacterium]|nr:hypothetical protein [Coriobacteriia bacterium]
MSDAPIDVMSSTEELEARAVGRRRTWIVVIAVAVGLLACSCMSTVFLVLTGIIAEPVTVIEETLRLIQALIGG